MEAMFCFFKKILAEIRQADDSMNDGCIMWEEAHRYPE
jgi:hypothetical protein